MKLVILFLDSKTAILNFFIPKRRFFLPAKNKFVIPSQVNLLDMDKNIVIRSSN